MEVSVTHPLSQSSLKAGSANAAMTAARHMFNKKLREYDGFSREKGVKFILLKLLVLCMKAPRDFSTT